MAETDTVGDALPREKARVRDEVLPHYVEIGPVGAFGALMIRQDLDRAARAMATGDTVEMIRCLQALRECKS